MSTKPLLAFHNDAKIKAKYLGRVKAHTKADEVVQGQYWQNGKGCAVGCTIHGDEHSKYQTELGIPIMLARLEDRIFEGLPKAKAKKWPQQFLTAIKTGADLNGVADKFLAWLVRDLLRFAKRPDAIKAINTVADLYDRRVLGEVVAVELWREARRAAAAAAAAAYAADAAAAAAAAYAAADAAADAAAYATTAAAYAAARSNHYILMSEKLLELLKAAK